MSTEPQRSSGESRAAGGDEIPPEPYTILPAFPRKSAPEQPAHPLVEHAKSERRVSLRGLLVVMSLAAVLFAIGRALPLNLFAGACGIGVVVGLVADAVFRVSSPVLVVAWWLLLLVYICVAIAAARAQLPQF